MRVLITGSRRTTLAEDDFIRSTVNAVYRDWIDQLETDPDHEFVLVDGDCPYGGADVACRTWVAIRGPRVRSEQHPADWNTHGKAAGPIRNQAMVDLGADLCLAFPRADSKGTWDCVRRAADAGIPVHIHPLSATARKAR
jgi:hypothetical protein